MAVTNKLNNGIENNGATVVANNNTNTTPAVETNTSTVEQPAKQPQFKRIVEDLKDDPIWLKLIGVAAKALLTRAKDAADIKLLKAELQQGVASVLMDIVKSGNVERSYIKDGSYWISDISAVLGKGSYDGLKARASVLAVVKLGVNLDEYGAFLDTFSTDIDDPEFIKLRDEFLYKNGILPKEVQEESNKIFDQMMENYKDRFETESEPVTQQATQAVQQPNTNAGINSLNDEIQALINGDIEEISTTTTVKSNGSGSSSSDSWDTGDYLLAGAAAVAVGAALYFGYNAVFKGADWTDGGDVIILD